MSEITTTTAADATTVAATPETPATVYTAVPKIAAGHAWRDHVQAVLDDEVQLARDNDMESCKCVLARAIELGVPYTFNRIEADDMNWRRDVRHTAVAAMLTAMGGTFQIEHKNHGGRFITFSWPDGMVRYEINRYATLDESYLNASAWVATCNIELRDAIMAAFKPFFIKPRVPPPVYGSSLHMLTGTPLQGYNLRSIGHVGAKLCRENYTSEVLVGLDMIEKSLLDPNPAGRISLLEGPPGTGKTRAVTAMLAALCNQARVVIVPSHMVADLSGPNLIGTLIGYPGPTVLVLEDADSAMLSREAASEKDKDLNTGALASLLNLSDGLIGSLIDLRIVATTNAKVQEIDPALLRPGRLLCRTHLGNLNRTTAAKIVDRETGLPASVRESYLDRFENKDNEARLWWVNGPGPTLAEAYEVARRIKLANPVAAPVEVPADPAKKTRTKKTKKGQVAGNIEDLAS